MKFAYLGARIAIVGSGAKLKAVASAPMCMRRADFTRGVKSWTPSVMGFLIQPHDNLNLWCSCVRPVLWRIGSSRVDGGVRNFMAQLEKIEEPPARSRFASYPEISRRSVWCAPLKSFVHNALLDLSLHSDPAGAKSQSLKLIHKAQIGETKRRFHFGLLDMTARVHLRATKRCTSGKNGLYNLMTIHGSRLN